MTDKAQYLYSLDDLIAAQRESIPLTETEEMRSARMRIADRCQAEAIALLQLGFTLDELHTVVIAGRPESARVESKTPTPMVRRLADERDEARRDLVEMECDEIGQPESCLVLAAHRWGPDCALALFTDDVIRERFGCNGNIEAVIRDAHAALARDFADARGPDA